MTLKIAPTSDGRRQRSERSQVAIVEAALALINEEKTGADRAAGRGSRRREYPLLSFAISPIWTRYFCRRMRCCGASYASLVRGQRSIRHAVGANQSR